MVGVGVGALGSGGSSAAAAALAVAEVVEMRAAPVTAATDCSDVPAPTGPRAAVEALPADKLLTRPELDEFVEVESIPPDCPAPFPESVCEPLPLPEPICEPSPFPES